MIFSSATLWFISIACVPLSVTFFLCSLKQKKIWWNMTTLAFVFIACGLIVVQQYEDYARFTDCIRKGFNYNAFSGECSVGVQDIK
ncbi:hypothetical protein CZ809_00887 [Photobacterium piscicola]|uniref:Uncharacterized protein n=2 Tax=Photobacterium piscicola TaxID=1378299 RepID=A0A1T5HX71_9GAMM|nr:hypothetical protein CZ809_00887 [Photobacterium piscicola]